MYTALGLAIVALPAALAITYDVSVGADSKLAFNPQFVNAAAGDIVNFVFHPKNHTVTQSSFNTPCVPLAGGLDSSFKPVAASETQFPNFQVTVSDAQPVWFHCQQKGHCGQGMVFAINPPADPSPKSFKAFQDLAIATNGTSSTTATAPTATATYVTPSSPQWQSATATVTNASSVWTTIYTSYAGTPQPTVAAQPIDHKIIVGANGNLVYNPANITAAIGDTVTFEFHPKNHTVTQSAFSSPCQPLQDTSRTGAVGFKSGFRPVSANVTDFPQFKITINDTAPIWGYCGQVGHCGAGMVFSINAVESGPNNFAAFSELAKRINGTASSSPSGSATGTSASSPSATRSSGAIFQAAVSYSAIVWLGIIVAIVGSF